MTGDSIKGYLKKNNINQDILAKKINMDRANLSARLGKAKISLEFQKRITEALDLPEGYFQDAEEKPVIQVANNNTNSTRKLKISILMRIL